MFLGIKGKNAVITGGSHGIGLATARLLAAEGCNIAVLARDPIKLAKTKKEVETYGVECLTVKVNVLCPEDLEESFSTLAKAWDRIDILINNVGGGGRWGIDDIEKNTDQVWEEVYHKNLTVSRKYTQFVLPYMRKHKWGRVVTVTSTLGRQAGGRPWFNIAKVAQTCLMKNLSLRKELVRDNITFNSVAPGCIMIPDTGWEKEKKNSPKKFKEFVDERFPLGRMGEPEEVAYSIVMLCGQQASLINGAALAVDGGESFAL